MRVQHPKGFVIRVIPIGPATHPGACFAGCRAGLWPTFLAEGMEGRFFRRACEGDMAERRREMIEKRVLCPERVRGINGSFAFIEHRFLRDGFWSRLDHYELVLYFFLVMVGDRNGISFYCYDRICTLLGMSVDDYIQARNALIEKDLIAFDGKMFQVLSLPEKVVDTSRQPLKNPEEMKRHDPAAIHHWLSIP